MRNMRNCIGGGRQRFPTVELCTLQDLHKKTAQLAFLLGVILGVWAAAANAGPRDFSTSPTLWVCRVSAAYRQIANGGELSIYPPIYISI